MAHMQKALDVPVYDFSRVAVLEENVRSVRNELAESVADHSFIDAEPLL
jgi:hypothetical protein